MAIALSARFFVQPVPGLLLHHPDDPPPLPKQDIDPFLASELEEYLRATSSSSAPGPSQISWPILKWLWPVLSAHVTTLFNGCLAHAFHPPLWKHAIVQVIPKPGKSDYFAPKSYRPISLLDCLGKLMEKAIAKRITHAIDVVRVLPLNQFGSRAWSCCLDAAPTLTHHIYLAHKINWRAGALLFDISGFFDNINRDRLRVVLLNRGFSSLLVDWIDAFLTDHTLRLRFNDLVGPLQFQQTGTPQGSPLSPILSALYTAPLLLLSQTWEDAALSLYVDDGLIFASSPSWTHVQRTLQDCFALTYDWLSRAGLSLESSKTELIFFKRSHDKLTPPTRLF